MLEKSLKPFSSFEAFEEIKALMKNHKLTGKGITSIWKVLRKDDVADMMKEKPEVVVQVVPFVVEWVLASIRKMTTPPRNTLDTPLQDRLRFYHSSGDRSEFREHYGLSLLFKIFELCGTLPESSLIAEKDILNALSLVDKCNSANVKKQRPGSNDALIRVANGGSPTYTSSQATKTGLIGYPGFVPPQILLTTLRLAEGVNKAFASKITAKIEGLLPFEMNHMAALFRLRCYHVYQNTEKGGELSFQVFFRLLVHIGMTAGGPKVVEERMGQFIATSRTTVWVNSKTAKRTGGRQQRTPRSSLRIPATRMTSLPWHLRSTTFLSPTSTRGRRAARLVPSLGEIRQLLSS